MAATGTPTPNLGLRIPVGTDPASVDDINYNSNLLDTKIGAVGSTSVQDQIDAVNSQMTGAIGWSNDGKIWLKASDDSKNYRLQLENNNGLYLLSQNASGGNWTNHMNIPDSISQLNTKTSLYVFNQNVKTFTFTVGSGYFAGLFVGMIASVGNVFGLVYAVGNGANFVRLDGNISGFKGTDAFSVTQSGTTVTVTALNNATFREATIIL
jgi:hypothetical protein